MTAALPRLLVLTDRRASARRLRDTVAAAVDGGARAVVLREKDLPTAERRRLAEELAAVLDPVDGLLVLAGAASLAAPGTAPGPTLRAGAPAVAVTALPGPATRVAAVHLASDEAVPAGAVRPRLVGRSCHDGVDVTRAAAEGCDWVTLSPVYASPSKPGYGPPLGPRGLAALAPGAPPVFALGGVDARHVAECVGAGAHGVAVLGSVMRALRPDRAVAALLSALEEAAP